MALQECAFLQEPQHKQQDRQCTYNVTLKSFRATTVTAEINYYHIFWVRMSSLMYPARNACAPYGRLWPVRLNNISSTLSHKRHDFPGGVLLLLDIKYVFDFLQKNCLKHVILRRIEKDMIKNVKRLLFLSDFNETWDLSPIFEKYSNFEVQENPSSGSRTVPCWQTDGLTHKHDEANSRFSQFCKRA